MAKDKLNHRNKSKKVKEYVPLNVDDFKDIITKPKRDRQKDKKGYKGNKPYKSGDKKPYNKQWAKIKRIKSTITKLKKVTRLILVTFIFCALLFNFNLYSHI